MLSKIFRFDVRSPWFWLGAGLLAVYIRGLFLDVMDVDASQYASISMEMLQNGSWLEVKHRGGDYLDKPPLLFWMSAASFTLFGLSNWAYKLPSLLVAFAGAYAVYRFCLLYYPARTARQAAFILLSSLGLIIICNDVRTDTLLLGFTTLAVWMLAEYLERDRLIFLAGGFFCIALAMMAKGPIGLVAPAFGVGTHLLFSGRWRDVFRWQWLAGLAVTALALAPMCWGLWQQFDLHPEKLVNGRTGVSGLYFFFWEQSFGRITGENVWRNDASGFYFLHVYLWAFLPWCLLLPGAWWSAWPQRQTRAVREYYSLGAFTLTFIALSMSHYKLPHYIFITLPWAAVLVAGWLNRRETVSRFQWIGLYVSVLIGLTIGLLIPGFMFPGAGPAFWTVVLAALAVLLYRIWKSPFAGTSDTLVLRGTGAALLIGLIVNFYFYPKLLPYQVSRPIAEFARAQGIPPEKMVGFRRGSHALDFYNGHILEGFDSPELLRDAVRINGTLWAHTDEAGKRDLEQAGLHCETAGVFRHFQVALLKAAFLDPARRDKTLETVYLLKISAE